MINGILSIEGSCLEYRIEVTVGSSFTSERQTKIVNPTMENESFEIAHLK
jgi:hypothetical protein